MKVTIHEKNLKINDFQRDYIMKKIDHLKTFGERVDDESTMVHIKPLRTRTLGAKI